MHPSLCDFYLHSILENILANPKIGFNPYNFTKILGDFTYLKWCKALASSIWFCLQKLLCWCPKKSFLRQESAYGRKSHHATTIYGGAIQIQVNKGTRKRTNPFPGGDEEKKSWDSRQKMRREIFVFLLNLIGSFWIFLYCYSNHSIARSSTKLGWPAWPTARWPAGFVWTGADTYRVKQFPFGQLLPTIVESLSSTQEHH